MPIDMSAAKAPPRRTSAGSKPRVLAPPAKTIRDMREEGLQGLGQLAQGILMMGQQYADAGAVGMHFPAVATELANLADQYEVIAKPIDILIQTGPFAALIAAGLPLVMQIAANHKLIDAERTIGSSVVPPEVLESQMKANISRMQAAAMRERQEAIREAQQAESEMAQMMAEMTRENQPA